MDEGLAIYVSYATDDAEKAFSMLMQKRRDDPEEDWSMAETRVLSDPPKTDRKWVVFRVEHLR